MDELMNTELKSFVDSINSIKEFSDEQLTDEVTEEMISQFNAMFSGEITNRSVHDIINNLEAQGNTKIQAQEAVAQLKELIRNVVYGDEIVLGNKRKILDNIVDNLFYIFDKAAEQFHSYAIELPIMLEDGAQEPTYAHESDAAADLYAMEDVTIPAHFLSVPIKTGVHIQLPEGWVAMVLPRSSIGAKTSLRLSNSQGVIDSGYRGEVRAIYDNIGEEPYEIHKGDRIAQMYIMPSYRFKAKIVDSLEDSDRGEGGFGSTGA